jgi:FtsH-binding integral membrane protein
MSFKNGFQQDQYHNPYAALASGHVPAAQSTVIERIGFIRKTYLHLAGAVAGVIAIEAAIFGMFGTETIIQYVSKNITGMSWLLVFGAFMAVSFIANKWAHSDTSTGVQYAGLILYVIAEALILVPILAIAGSYFPGAIASAGIITAIVFVGLTATVFVTQADFSFLRTGLMVAGFAAFGAIIAGTVLGLNIFGAVFASLMIALACGYILYDTSNVLHHYRPSQHVAASLALFSSVATLFWYVLRLVMILQEE